MRGAQGSGRNPEPFNPMITYLLLWLALSCVAALLAVRFFRFQGTFNRRIR